MTDKAILDHISELVEEEHHLFKLGEQEPLTDEQHARLKAIGVQLDQTWDLLRQRRARREFGTNPDSVEERTESTVEHYLQ